MQLVCDTEGPLPAVLGIFMVNTTHTTPCLSSSGREQEKERHFQGCMQNTFLKMDNFSFLHDAIMKGQHNCIQNVMPSSSTFTCSCCNEHSSNILFSLLFKHVFQALIDCIERFGNNAYQDLVPKRTRVLS